MVVGKQGHRWMMLLRGELIGNVVAGTTLCKYNIRIILTQKLFTCKANQKKISYLHVHVYKNRLDLWACKSHFTRGH